ncbi:MAG: hypothetical protein F4Z77_00285 [Dehalococcoidia bacterium]|nr:hypothetical protein [Dehalococcoidia bacterium]
MDGGHAVDHVEGGAGIGVAAGTGEALAGHVAIDEVAEGAAVLGHLLEDDLGVAALVPGEASVDEGELPGELVDAVPGGEHVAAAEGLGAADLAAVHGVQEHLDGQLLGVAEEDGGHVDALLAPVRAFAHGQVAMGRITPDLVGRGVLVEGSLRRRFCCHVPSPGLVRATRGYSQE